MNGSIKLAAFVVFGVVLLAVAGLYGWRLLSPEVLIENASSEQIAEAIIELPSNRIEFGKIFPQSKATIYYDASQKKGTYRYRITLLHGTVVEGECGNVEDGELTKRLHVRLLGPNRVECTESTKL